MCSRPVECLIGRELSDDWKVTELVNKPATATGGKFSVGYKVVHKNGNEGFLKAHDFSTAMQSTDQLKSLQALLSAFNFERDLLSLCKERGMHRVVTPLSYGNVLIDGFGSFGVVHYMIFELGKSDVRNYVRTYQDQFNAIDVAWALRSLHQVAVGLQQLHGEGITHHDIKPSNVVYFGNDGSRITDLGRASKKGVSGNYDNLPVQGDVGYMPPELAHLNRPLDYSEKYLVDIYLLGSMIYFYFANVSARAALISTLQKGVHHPLIGQEDYRQLLPYYQNAFAETIKDLRLEINKVVPSLQNDIVQMAYELCNPDPSKRGDPGWRNSIVPQHDLQRYISRLDLIAKKAEYKLL